MKRRDLDWNEEEDFDSSMERNPLLPVYRIYTTIYITHSLELDFF